MIESKQAQAPKRLPYIDVTKGIAIVLVVLGHIVNKEPTIYPGDTDAMIKAAVYSFHMPFFFFISGYCRALAAEKRAMTGAELKKQTGRCAQRLLLPFFLWTLLYYCYKASRGNPNPLRWFLLAITFRGSAPVWFLAALFWGEVLFMVLQFFFRDRMPGYCIVSVLCGMGTVLMSPYMMAIHKVERAIEISIEETGIDVDPFTQVGGYIQLAVFRLLPTVFFISCGYLFYRLMALARDRKIPSVLFILLGAAGVAGAIYLHLSTGNNVNLQVYSILKPRVFLVTGVLGSAGLVWFCMGVCRWLPLRIFQALGRKSMGIMVIHYPPIPTIGAAQVLCDLIVLEPTPLVHLLLLLTLTTAISYVATILLEHKFFV